MEAEAETHIEAVDLITQSPFEEGEEWEYEQQGQDHDGFTH